MILFCHFANSTSFGPLQTTCWFQPDVGFCDETSPTSTCLCELITQQHHRPSDHQMHSWLTIKDPEIEDRFSKQSLFNKKNYSFSKLSCCIRRENYRVWVLYIYIYIDDFFGAKLSFPEASVTWSIAEDCPKIKRTWLCGLGAKEMRERDPWHHRHHLFMHDILII